MESNNSSPKNCIIGTNSPTKNVLSNSFNLGISTLHDQSINKMYIPVIGPGEYKQESLTGGTQANSNFKNSPKFMFSKQEKLQLKGVVSPPVGNYNQSYLLTKCSPYSIKFGKDKKGDQYWRRKLNSLSPGPVYHYALPDDVTHQDKQNKVPRIENEILSNKLRTKKTDFSRLYPHSYNMPSSFDNTRGHSIGPSSKYLDDLFHKNRFAAKYEDKNTPSPNEYSAIDSTKLSTFKSPQHYSIPKNEALHMKIDPNLSPASYHTKVGASSAHAQSQAYSFGRSNKAVDVREWNQNYNSARVYVK